MELDVLVCRPGTHGVWVQGGGQACGDILCQCMHFDKAKTAGRPRAHGVGVQVGGPPCKGEVETEDYATHGFGVQGDGPPRKKGEVGTKDYASQSTPARSGEGPPCEKGIYSNCKNKLNA